MEVMAMHLLGSGRPAFLEFLRNLTPQALLLAFTLVMWLQLDFHKFDVSNWQKTSAFFAAAAIFVFAFIANALNFFESYATATLAPVEVRMAKARRRVASVHGRFALLWRGLYAHKLKVLSHLIVTILVMEVGLLLVTWVGVKQAIQMIRIGG